MNTDKKIGLIGDLLKYLSTLEIGDEVKLDSLAYLSKDQDMDLKEY